MFVVDRIENNIIVCEDENGNVFNINKEDCIGNIKEGDVLIKENAKWIVDKSKTLERKRYIEEITKDMWEN